MNLAHLIPKTLIPTSIYRAEDIILTPEFYGIPFVVRCDVAVKAVRGDNPMQQRRWEEAMLL